MSNLDLPGGSLESGDSLVGTTLIDCDGNFRKGIPRGTPSRVRQEQKDDGEVRLAGGLERSDFQKEFPRRGPEARRAACVRSRRMIGEVKARWRCGAKRQ